MSIPVRKRKNFYGNYGKYYDFRGEDKRVQLLEPFSNYIKSKRCLDIGCNEGKFVLDIARKYVPQRILGIDKDEALIREANGHLSNLKLSYTNTTSFAPRSIIISQTGKDSYPLNIEFLCADFFEYGSMQRFETVFCLSVAKWIHLNLGDEGIMSFFRLVFDSLVDGGAFIFEYQPWKSYKNKRRLNQSTMESFKNIKRKPEDFERVLVDEIGFHKLGSLGPSIEEASGYNRPILVLQKNLSLVERPSLETPASEHKSVDSISLELDIPVSSRESGESKVDRVSISTENAERRKSRKSKRKRCADTT